MHTRGVRWSEHSSGRKKTHKILLFDPSIAHNTIITHPWLYMFLSRPSLERHSETWRYEWNKWNETKMRNQHVKVNRNLSHHSKHSYSGVRYPLLSTARFFTAPFFPPGNSFTWGSYHKMVIGLTSKMVLSLYTQNVTALFIFTVLL